MQQSHVNPFLKFGSGEGTHLSQFKGESALAKVGQLIEHSLVHCKAADQVRVHVLVASLIPVWV